jgi:deferrochelatase/peroxidase EfeB
MPPRHPARDPRRQFVPVQRRLAEHDALSAFSRPVGSAVFAIPPGARGGDAVAAGIFERPG